jgi:hypothetical protein
MVFSLKWLGSQDPVSWCFVVLNDFSDDEVQELLGEFRVQIGPFRQVFEPCDLRRFAGGIGRGKVVFGLELAHGLGVLEALAQGVDEDRVEPVDALAVALQKLRGAGGGVGHERVAPAFGRLGPDGPAEFLLGPVAGEPRAHGADGLARGLSSATKVPKPRRCQWPERMASTRQAWPISLSAPPPM